MNALFPLDFSWLYKQLLCFISQAAALDVFGLGENLQAVGAHGGGWRSSYPGQNSPDVLLHIHGAGTGEA